MLARSIIGAKVAAPDRPAIAYVGDGAWGMSFGEILTCVRERLSGHRGCLPQQAMGRGKEEIRWIFMTRVSSARTRKSELGGMARSHGCGRRHHRQAFATWAKLFATACDAQEEGKTTVIEVMVTQELGDPFRRDALKKPKRLLQKYEIILGSLKKYEHGRAKPGHNCLSMRAGIYGFLELKIGKLQRNLPALGHYVTHRAGVVTKRIRNLNLFCWVLSWPDR